MVKRRIIIALLGTAAILSLSACSGKNKQSPSDTGTNIATESQIPIQQQTTEATSESITEAQTETETKAPETEMPQKTLEELQSLFKETGRSGKMQYEIITSDGKQSGEGDFVSNNGVFELKEDGEAIAYADSDASYIEAKSGGWKEGSVIYYGLLNPFKEGNGAFLSEVTGEGANRRYKISLSDTTQVTGEAALPLCLWYNEVAISQSATVYYLDDSGNLTRIDVSLAFTGIKDSLYVEGKYNAVFSVNGMTEEKPEVPDEILSEIYPDYTPGELTETMYTNEMFDIKIAGKDFITFDLDTTETMSASNKESGNGYTAEAVGNCEGGIISLTSAKFASSGNEAEAMQKYLKSCNAENIGAAESVKINDVDTIRCAADINGTSTYTYCLQSGSRILFMTIYYKEATTVDEILAHVYHIWEDPDWVETTWILDGTYMIHTPKNYKVVESGSSEYYLCLKKTGMEEVNVFVLSNTTVDEQLSEDIAGDGDSVNELLNQDGTDVNGNYTTYAVIKEKTQTSQYITYELLQQAGNDVIKYFVVSLEEDGDYMEELASIAATMEIPQAETEAVSEAEEAENGEESTELATENESENL